MAELKQLLQKLNLNEKEARVFLSLVKIGKAPVSAVGRESGITRTHIYDLVQSLVEKGLVSEIEERGIKNYEAVDHAGLLAFVSKEQKELQSLEKELMQKASEFNALQVGKQQKTKVRFFDGVEGVRNIYEEIRKDFEKSTERFELLTIFSPERVEAVMPGFQFFSYPKAETRDIICEDQMLAEYQAQMEKTKHEVRYKLWPKEKGLFPTDNIAWKNKIAYIDLVGYPSGIIIENEAVVKSFTMWFNQMWEGLK
jgi:predicted transcriptional regulator